LNYSLFLIRTSMSLHIGILVSLVPIKSEILLHFQLSIPTKVLGTLVKQIRSAFSRKTSTNYRFMPDFSTKLSAVR
jgi:hypothetical protein